MDVTYSVPDVSCGHCKSAIEGALQPLAERANVDIDAKKVDVTFDESVTPEAAIRGAIQAAGYDIAG